MQSISQYLSKRLTISVLATLLFLTVFNVPIMHAASVSSLDSIRVTLFIDQRGTVPAVTLSHAQSLNISLDSNHQTIQPFLPVATKLRASIDSYKVKLLETKDYQVVASINQSYKNTETSLFTFVKQIQGQTVYQVYIGNYSTAQEAERARNTIASMPAITPYIQNSTLKITGSRHVSVGTFAQVDEAVNKQNQLLNYGFDAWLVQRENESGEIVTSVWTGEETSDQGMASLKSAILNVLPATVFETAHTDRPYVMAKSEMIPGDTILPHFIIGTQDQKLIISSDTPGIGVKERYGRTYRGQMEIRAHNGKLALINELPFEQYLYSVVSTEMGAGFPLEALKAQAVAARTYALTLGMKYGIAHISDTTYDQAYKGYGAEIQDAVLAVQQTEAEVLMNDQGLIVPFYSSNAGGMTALPEEVWGTPLDYIHSVKSPDEVAGEQKLDWHQAVMQGGHIGYIRSDFTRMTGDRNAAGLPIAEVIEDGINVRAAPYVNNANNPALFQVNRGDQIIVFNTVLESNAYAWMRGPYTSDELKSMIQLRLDEPLTGAVTELQITKRGPSGRVQEITANDHLVSVTTPDSYRTVFGSLPSTRFDIEEVGAVTVLGAGGSVKYTAQAQFNSLRGLQGTSSQAKKLATEDIFIMNAEGNARLSSTTPQFLFKGYGFGHGIGMSQWGAKGLVDTKGYDYQQILKYYFKDVSIVKG